jgi:hypothetical protein
VLEDIEVRVFNVLTLGPLLTKVDELRILFRTLDRLEELTACIRGFCNEIRQIVVNTLFSLVIPNEIDQARDRRPNSCILLLCSTEAPSASTWPPSKPQPTTGRSTLSFRRTSISVARTLATTRTVTSITPTGSVKTVAWKPLGKAHPPTAANPLTFSIYVTQRTLTECVDATERANTPTTERGLLYRMYQHAVEDSTRVLLRPDSRIN